MKKIIRLTESDLTRIVRRVIKEQDERDEELGQTDKGEERLQDLVVAGRHFLEDECRYEFDDINTMNEYEVMGAVYEEGNDKLASRIEKLLKQEGFEDTSMKDGLEDELDEGHDDFTTQSRYDDYSQKDHKRIPKGAVKPGKFDFEGTSLKYKGNDDDDFDPWSLDDSDEEYV
jgi:hypothetical protein